MACNRTEWDPFRKGTGATTHLDAFASVVTTFEGLDDGFGEEGSPHLFMTMAWRHEHSEAKGHRNGLKRKPHIAPRRRDQAIARASRKSAFAEQRPLGDWKLGAD